MENPVLESTKGIYENSKHIKVNKDQIIKISEQFAKEDLVIPEWNDPVFLDTNWWEVVDFFFLANSINFAFTDFKSKIKFETEYQGVKWRRAYGMFACLKRAYENKIPILDSNYLKQISKGDMKKIFSGNIEIPMLDERTDIFREVGKILSEKYLGSFSCLLTSSQNKLFNNNKGLVEKLVCDFPSFNDSMKYKGKKVCFYKRAQLAPAMLYEKFHKKFELFKDIDKLTVFADYVLPKALRDLGIFEYSKALKNKVDNGVLIKSNSKTELEIRACTIHAADILIKEINQRKEKKINALHLDYKLWSESRKTPSLHHLTETIAY